jgi:hypothetical protein
MWQPNIAYATLNEHTGSDLGDLGNQTIADWLRINAWHGEDPAAGHHEGGIYLYHGFASQLSNNRKQARVTILHETLHYVLGSHENIATKLRLEGAELGSGMTRQAADGYYDSLVDVWLNKCLTP